MKAQDPHGPKGQMIDVTFPSGPGVERWDKVCQDCGAIAGGCFSGPGLPPVCKVDKAVCPTCSSRNIGLRKVQ